MLTFIGKLVKAAEGIDLIIANVGHRGIYEAGRLRADGGYELWSVALRGRPAVPDRARPFVLT